MVSDGTLAPGRVSGEPVLQQVCGLLLDRLRAELSPSVLASGDAVRLAYPGAELDYRLGVFLHDLEEIHPYGPLGEERLGDSARRSPGRLLALHLLLYANRKVPFDGMEGMDELLLLEGAVRAAQDLPPLAAEGQRVRVGLHPLTRGEKTALWQSLGAPLQPAVYLTLEPVWVPGGRIRAVHPVREVRLSAHRKGADGP